MKKKIIVLGMHNGRNARAALIKNGPIVDAMPEEKIGCLLKTMTGRKSQMNLGVFWRNRYEYL